MKQILQCAAAALLSLVPLLTPTYAEDTPKPASDTNPKPIATPASATNAQTALAALLKKHPPATLMILNILDWSHIDIKPYIPAIDSLDPVGPSMFGEEQRMVEFLRESHGLPVPPVTQKASANQKKGDTAKDM